MEHSVEKKKIMHPYMVLLNATLSIMYFQHLVNIFLAYIFRSNCESGVIGTRQEIYQAN